jgi:hypothetical protein
MTLQDLIDELQALPMSARTAYVDVRTETFDLTILSIRYDHGEVVIECEGDEREGAEPDDVEDRADIP